MLAIESGPSSPRTEIEADRERKLEGAEQRPEVADTCWSEAASLGKRSVREKRRNEAAQ